MATIVERPKADGTISYRIQVRVKNRGTGQYVTKITTFHPDPARTLAQNKRALKEFALNYEKEVRAIYERGQVIDKNIKVKDFTNVWLRFVRLNRSPTYANSLVRILKDINENLGEYRLDELTPMVIQSYIDDLKLGEYKEAKMVNRIFDKERAKQQITLTYIRETTGVAPSTVRHVEKGEPVSYRVAELLTKALGKENPLLFFNVYEESKQYASGTKGRRYRTLRAMLSYAVKHQYVERNYATSEYVDGIRERHKHRDYLDDEEIKRLLVSLKYSDNIPAKVAIMTLIFTGIRRGELCGLEWQDINFDKATMNIERTSKEIPGMGLVTGDTKTEGSKRKIALPQILIAELKEYKDWWDDMVKMLGDRYDGCNRLFLSTRGGPIAPNTILNWLHAETDRAGLKRVCVHSLRHSNITIQLAAGVPLRTVAERAGHSTTKVTADIYAHMIKSSNRDAADKLDEIFSDTM